MPLFTAVADKYKCKMVDSFDLTCASVNKVDGILIIKGIVNPKMKIILYFTHLQVVPNLYTFISSVTHKNIF